MRKSVFNFDINKHKKLPRLNVKAMSIAHENSDGPRMLLISDYIPYSDINDSKEKSVGVVFGNEEGQVLFNLLGHVTKKNSGFKEVVVFNWYNVDNESISEASFDSKKAKDAATRLYANQRLRAFIHKMKPDVVCFSGMEAFNSYMQHYHADSFPKKVNFSNKFNRLIELEDKGFTCKYIGTMDIRRAASQKQEDIKKYTNLLGFIADALNTARQGENRYNVKLGKIDIVYINSITKFEKFYKKLCVKDIVSIDSETVGVKRIANTLFSIQFAFDRNPKRSYFLPIDHPDTPFNKKELAYIKQRLADYFEKGKSVFHIYQNGKFDIQQFLQQLQIRFYNHKIYDVMAGEYALDENRKLLAKRGGANAVEKPFSLDAIAEYYGIDIYSRIAFSKGDRVDMTQVKLDNKFIKYSCIDTVVPILIVRCQLKEAEHRGQKTFKRFILRVISNTILAIAQMEHTGAYIDKDYVYELKGANSAIDKQIKDLLQKIKDLPSVKKANRLLIQSKNIPTGFVEPWVFNINKEASKQMLFFNVLKLEPTKLTKKGTGAINKDFKNKYKDLLEVKLMDDYEKLKKLKTTYVDGFFKKLTRDLDCRDSKIRSDYIWNEISTGRLGSRDPNLQNIISRGDLAKTIKRCFIAQEWRILFKNDYSAHEVRGWANLANDIRLSGSFDSGLRMRRKLRILINKYRVEAADWRKFKDKHEWDKIKVYDEKKKLVDGLKNKAQRKIAALDLQIEVFGDIHKLNCQHFWGTHPLKVTADQRQAVKAVVFGVIYGKCVLFDSIVPTSDGLLTIGELRARSLKNSVANFEGYAPYKTTVVSHENKDVKTSNTFATRGKTWVAKTMDGDEIEGLPEHRLWIMRDKRMQFIRLDELKPKDWLPKSIGTELYANKIPKLNYIEPKYNYHSRVKLDVNVPKYMSEELAKLFGLFVAEGCKHGSFTNADITLLNKFQKLLKKVFGSYREIEKAREDGVRNIRLGRDLKDFFNYYLGTGLSADKFVPEIIRCSPKNIQKAFLQGLWEGDGSVWRHKTGGHIVEYSSISKSLIYQIKAMLENMGISCYVNETKPWATNGSINQKQKVGYKLKIKTTALEKFQESVGFMRGSNKTKLLKEAVDYSKDSEKSNIRGRHNAIPANHVMRKVYDRLETICKKTKYSYTMTNRWGTQTTATKTYKLGAITGGTHAQLHTRSKDQLVTLRAVATLKEKIKNCPIELRKIINSDKKLSQYWAELDNISAHYWTQIKSSVPTNKIKDVGDLVVPGPQSYHVNGLISHNTAAGLAESLGISEEKAQELIDLLFEKFKEGGDWIKTVIREAQKQLFVLSPAGMIRHLWAYLHNKQGVRNAMDRRGPNSIIQGLASQQGVDSMRNLQVLFWNYIVNNGVENPLWKVITNYVHDSVESENWIHMAPLHLYFLEHASTTLVHKNYEDIHGMKFKVGLEVEFQMGPSMDKLYTWKWGYDELREYVIKTLDWQKSMFKNPNHDKIAKRILKAFEHNLNLISKIRAKELKRFSGKHNAIEKTMLMKPHHIKKLGFITNVEGVN